MPIIFIGETSAIATDDIEQTLVVRFRLLDRNQNPLIGVSYRGTLRYENMIFSELPLGFTDENGEGTVSLIAIPSIGSFDLLRVICFVDPNSPELGQIPVVLYNPDMEPKLTIDRGWYSNGFYVVTRDDVDMYGLHINATLPEVMLPWDNAFVVIGAFYQSRISLVPTSVTNFIFPPAINGVHVLNLGSHKVFYGLNKISSNIYVPMFTTLLVLGSGPTQRLLPLILNTRGGQYINVLDNLYCIFPIIPGFQELIDIGDTWQAFYSMVEPVGPNPEFILISSGIVTSNNAIQFQTTSNFFPRVQNVPVWLWYSITKSDGRVLSARPIQRILDTL